MGFVSENDKKNARNELPDRRAVCTFFPVEEVVEHWAALPDALFAVMHAGSQLRSICKPLTLPLLPVRDTQTWVPCAAASCAASSRAATKAPCQIFRTGCARLVVIVKLLS
jgi:hypothetical protein